MEKELRKLTPEDITMEEEIIAENGKLNFCLCTDFDVDAVFGTHVCTFENEDYLNVYANYDMVARQVCEELEIVLWHGDDTCESLTYRLGNEEQQFIKAKMDDYCRKCEGMALDDFCAYLEKEENPLHQITTEELRHKARRADIHREHSPLTRKIVCGHCGSMVVRRVGKSGYTVWVCHKHDRKASSCPNGRISEQSIHASFLRMYHKLKANEGIILQPVLKQLASLTDALNRGNPAMQTINEAIAAAAEQNHNLSKLHTAGLLDAKTHAIRQAELNAKMTELRRQRRKLLCNDEIDEQVESVHRTVEVIQDGLDRLDSFDDALFALLVERIIAESQTTIRFQLYGGLEFTETLEER